MSQIKAGVYSSWSKLEDESWGIKVPNGVQREVNAGDCVEVQKRDGDIRVVELGAQVAVWNGRDKIFRVGKRHGEGNGSAQVVEQAVADVSPKSKAKMTKAEQQEQVAKARKLIAKGLAILDSIPT